MKENWVTGNKYLPSIILNNIEEPSELNSPKKGSKEERNVLVSRQILSVKLNPIYSSLKYCFVKGVVIPQTRVNENCFSTLGLYS